MVFSLVAESADVLDALMADLMVSDLVSSVVAMKARHLVDGKEFYLDATMVVEMVQSKVEWSAEKLVFAEAEQMVVARVRNWVDLWAVHLDAKSVAPLAAVTAGSTEPKKEKLLAE